MDVPKVAVAGASTLENKDSENANVTGARKKSYLVSDDDKQNAIKLLNASTQSGVQCASTQSAKALEDLLRSCSQQDRIFASFVNEKIMADKLSRIDIVKCKHLRDLLYHDLKKLITHLKKIIQDNKNTHISDLAYKIIDDSKYVISKFLTEYEYMDSLLRKILEDHSNLAKISSITKSISIPILYEINKKMDLACSGSQDFWVTNNMIRAKMRDIKHACSSIKDIEPCTIVTKIEDSILGYESQYNINFVNSYHSIICFRQALLLNIGKSCIAEFKRRFNDLNEILNLIIEHKVRGAGTGREDDIMNLFLKVYDQLSILENTYDRMTGDSLFSKSSLGTNDKDKCASNNKPSTEHKDGDIELMQKRIKDSIGDLLIFLRRKCNFIHKDYKDLHWSRANMIAQEFMQEFYKIKLELDLNPQNREHNKVSKNTEVCKRNRYSRQSRRDKGKDVKYSANNHNLALYETLASLKYTYNGKIRALECASPRELRIAKHLTNMINDLIDRTYNEV